MELNTARKKFFKMLRIAAINEWLEGTGFREHGPWVSSRRLQARDQRMGYGTTAGVYDWKK